MKNLKSDSNGKPIYIPVDKTTLAYSFDNHDAIQLLDLRNEHTDQFKGHAGGVKLLCISQDKKHLAALSKDNLLSCWNLENGMKTSLSKQKYGNSIEAITIAQDCKNVVSANQDGRVISWNIESGEAALLFLHPEMGVSCIRDISLGKKLAIGDAKGNVIIWDVLTKKIDHTIKSHKSRIINIDASADGKHMITASEDGAVKYWDLANYKLSREYSGSSGSVINASFAVNNSVTVTTFSNGCTKLIELISGKELFAMWTLDAGSEWLVITNDGHYDGSLKGREKPVAISDRFCYCDIK